MKKIIPIFVFMLLAAVPSLLRAQPSDIDSSRIKRDIRIMEGILDRLLDQDKMNMRFTGNCRGFYIPDYGMVFYLRRTQPYQPILLQQLEKNVQQVIVSRKDSGTGHSPPDNLISEEQFAEYEKAAEEIESKAMTGLKEGISDFLSNYASSTSILRKGDHITVLVELDGWRTPAYRNGFLAAVIDQEQAEALRRTKQTGKTGDSPIKFELKTHDANLSRDIDIISEILDQAMISGPAPRHSVTSGLYLNGLGALLVMDLQPQFWFGSMDTSFSIVIHQQGNNAPGMSVSQGEKKQTRKSLGQEQITQLGDEIFDLIASYGHTLRIKPEEKIHIEVNMAPRITLFSNQSSEPTTLRLQLVKKDVDDYNHGKIDLSELRKKLVLTTM